MTAGASNTTVYAVNATANVSRVSEQLSYNALNTIPNAARRSGNDCRERRLYARKQTNHY